MARTRLPMLRPCAHVRHDHLHRYSCSKQNGQECKPISNGPDLSTCPLFKDAGPPTQPTKVMGYEETIMRAKTARRKIAAPHRKPDDDDDDDLREHCPCSRGR